MINNTWRSKCAGILALAVLVLAWSAARAAPDTAPVPAVTVSDSDRLQFTQKNVEAQMQELQDRMFHLAEVVKDAEPESSTRLLMAVRKAAELRIMAGMEDVLAKLAAKNLQNIGEDTKEIVKKLNDLRNLLTATDLEFQMLLERLRQLNGAIAKVDQAIKEEKQEQGHSSGLADMMKKGTDVKPQALDDAKKDQEKNHERTDDVAKTVKELGNLDPAQQALAASGQSMSKAEGSLGGGKPGDASSQQSDATKKLQEARDALDKERQKVAEALQKQVKRIVVENLQDMLDRQVGVRQATEALAPRLDRDRAAVQQLMLLEKPEETIAAICQQTEDLVNETEFSVALPPALENLQRNMLYVAGDLKGGRGDERVIGTEKGIEQDLHDLLETFRDDSLDGPPGKCKGCKGNQNKLRAELKVIRMLQLRVNKQTLDADADAHRMAAAAELPPELREKIGKVRDGEGSVRDAMEKLHQQYGPGAPDDNQQEGEGTHDNPL